MLLDFFNRQQIYERWLSYDRPTITELEVLSMLHPESDDSRNF
jgi:hypothetical protein